MLLQELKNFSFDRYRPNGALEKCKIADLSIREFVLALRRWIFSFFADGYHPLLPAYALDTARFVQFHIEGHYSHDPEWWEIKPIVELPKPEHSFFRFLDAQFKKEFTERMGTLHLCATVPENCRIINWNGEEILKSGFQFLFNSKRCHLSSGFYDHTILKCEEANDQPFDLHEFRFMGAAFVISKSAPRFFATTQSLLDHRDLDFYGLNIELPAHWIDGAIELPNHFSERPLAAPRILDVPRWEAEVD